MSRPRAALAAFVLAAAALAACGASHQGPGPATAGSGAGSAGSGSGAGAGSSAGSAAEAGPPDAAGVHVKQVPPRDHREEGAMMASVEMGDDPDSRFGPLDVGADYLSYVRVTRKPFLSLVHGNRWVHVYVNKIGAEAYVKGTPIPVGTIIVKASWLDDGGRPSSVAGPVYIMEKRAPGYAPDHGDWYYAIRWAAPPADAMHAYGGPIYWRGTSPKVAFCYKCHDDYDRELGGLVPSSVLPR